MARYKPKTNTMLIRRVELKKDQITGAAYAKLMELLRLNIWQTTEVKETR